MVRSRVFQAAVKNAISSSTSTTTLASITNGLFHIIPTATTTTMLQQHYCQFNQKIVNSSSKRFFSSDDESSPPQDLKAILERELQEEESEETAPPPELSDLLKDIETEWTITSSSSSNLGGGGGGGATIKMYKKSAIPNGSKVSLVFHCQDTLPVVDTEDDDELDTGYLETEENEEEEEEEEESTAVRFTLIVSKAGKVMIMKCTSEVAEVDVEGLAVVSEEDLIVGKEGEVDEMLYQGPEFTELAQDLQEALTSYVRNECGIDSDVAAFISMYADYKEQVEYVSWLKDVKSMVS